MRWSLPNLTEVSHLVQKLVGGDKHGHKPVFAYNMRGRGKKMFMTS
jgi:hypothetical protein